jgi:hypothetical protein
MSFFPCFDCTYRRKFAKRGFQRADEEKFTSCFARKLVDTRAALHVGDKQCCMCSVLTLPSYMPAIYYYLNSGCTSSQPQRHRSPALLFMFLCHVILRRYHKTVGGQCWTVGEDVCKLRKSRDTFYSAGAGDAKWMVYPDRKSSQPCGSHRGPQGAPTHHLQFGPIPRARHRYPTEHGSRHHRAIS